MPPLSRAMLAPGNRQRDIAAHHLPHAGRERDAVRTLFGCIALLFCLRVLYVDILGLI
jgi:hypothetical protein